MKCVAVFSHTQSSRTCCFEKTKQKSHGDGFFFFCFLFFFPFAVERQSWLHQLVNHLVGRGWERKDIDGSRKKNKQNKQQQLCSKIWKWRSQEVNACWCWFSLFSLFFFEIVMVYDLLCASFFVWYFPVISFTSSFVGHEARHPNDTIFVIWISSPSFV